MADLKIIGITQNVQLPDHFNYDIPAKIDTGADDSSIWASSIEEKDGELSFVLFAPGSEFYTGEVIKNHEYRVTRIKNSFGVGEYRYKIKLRLKIDKKIYKVSFNLADRSHNRFPILIGKRFLRHRFVVDVSQNNVNGSSNKRSKKRPIVVLTSRINDETRDFFKIVAKKVSSELILDYYTSLKFEINENSEPRILLPDGRDIAIAKLVYFKAHNLFPEHAGAIVKYLQYKHVPFFDKELSNSVSRSKFSELFTLATNGVDVPQTIVVSENNNLPSYSELSSKFGNKFVIKDASSDRGKNNFLIIDLDSYNQAIDRLKETRDFVIQRYIDNDGFLRILMMGGEIVQVVKRLPADHKDPLRAHLNKPHGGINAAEIDEKDLGSDVIALARKAAIAMRRNIVGIDLIQDKITQKWYVLEANYNPDTVIGLNVPKKANGLAHLLESKER